MSSKNLSIIKVKSMKTNLRMENQYRSNNLIIRTAVADCILR